MKRLLFKTIRIIEELGAFLRNDFEPRVVTDARMLSESFKIRHKVYCEEYKYEDERATSEEVDSYDAHALHVLVHSTLQQQYVGCVRLVLSQFLDGDTHTLPLEKFSDSFDDPNIIRNYHRDGVLLAEVSRLCVVSSARNKNRVLTGVHIKKATSSASLIALYMGVFILAHHFQVKYLFAVVQPRLYESMRRLGIPVRTIGKELVHRGYRLPIAITVDEIEAKIPPLLYKRFIRIKTKLLKDMPDLPTLCALRKQA